MADSLVRQAYCKVKEECNANWQSDQARNALIKMVDVSLRFLVEQCQVIDLVSRVERKEYFSYTRDNIVARPANRQFFLDDPAKVTNLCEQWRTDRISPDNFIKLSYTAVLAPCLVMELFDRQNKKGPATYFECFIGHLFAKATGVNPTRKTRLPVHGRDVLMTMDFLIDMGPRKVHLPVKMSSRERIVQAWAHQRLLNAAYGEGTYRGIMVLFSETKLDSRSLEVVEICVPDQWLVYQSLLAQMERIYYFDTPNRYREMADQFPDVFVIKPFGEFFTETETILRS